MCFVAVVGHPKDATRSRPRWSLTQQTSRSRPDLDATSRQAVETMRDTRRDALRLVPERGLGSSSRWAAKTLPAAAPGQPRAVGRLVPELAQLQLTNAATRNLRSHDSHQPGAVCRVDLLSIKGAPARLPRGGRAHAACRPNLAGPRGADRDSLFRAPASPDPGVRRRGPVPLLLDRTASTARIKSATRPYGIGKPTLDPHRADLGWQLSGGRGRCGRTTRASLRRLAFGCEESTDPAWDCCRMPRRHDHRSSVA